jgi:hypothetical protein
MLLYPATSNPVNDDVEFIHEIAEKWNQMRAVVLKSE